MGQEMQGNLQGNEYIHMSQPNTVSIINAYSSSHMDYASIKLERKKETLVIGRIKDPERMWREQNHM